MPEEKIGRAYKETENRIKEAQGISAKWIYLVPF